MKISHIALSFAAFAGIGLSGCGQSESFPVDAETPAERETRLDITDPMKVFTVTCRDNAGREDLNERFVTRSLEIDTGTPGIVRVRDSRSNHGLTHVGGSCAITSRLQQTP